MIVILAKEASAKWYNWLPGLECLVNIVRALRIGSCLSDESANPVPDSPRTPTIKKGGRRSKVGPLNPVYEIKREELLRRIPGRMFLNGSSDIASLFTQQGKKGINQDAMIVWENLCSRAGTVLSAVFDGHGPYGHMVAKYVRDSLPQKLNAQWGINEKAVEIRPAEGTSFLSADVELRPSVDVAENLKPSDCFQTSKESFMKAFKAMDKELRMYSNIDCFCSGTTAVVLVKQGQNLTIGNIGDSRAVLATRDENGSLTAVQLTVDLKPNLPAEKARIQKCKGRVFALKDEPEVARVWLPKSNSPGLSMARAFGDFCLKEFGVISVPDVSCRRLSDKDEFVVLATDGIWDVLSKEEVVKIVDSCPKRSSAARSIVSSALKAWRSKYPSSKIDDCAVVCLFLDSNEQASCATESKVDIISPYENDDLPSRPLLETARTTGTA